MKNNNELAVFGQFVRSKKKNKVDCVHRTRGVIYTRASTKEQLDGGTLETQMEFCVNYAKSKEIEVIKYFGATNESAKTDDRKEFNKMIAFVKKRKDIGYIIVYSFKRFSRTGISKTYLDLEERGIKIVSATQYVDHTTSAGTFQKHMYMEMGRMDNENKRMSCVHGMQRKLRSGYWTGVTPFGYVNLNPGKRKTPELVITEEGKLLKKAFELKAKYDLTYQEITERLKKHGWTKRYKALSEYFRNPFYCGLIVSSLIPEEVIEGKHPALISKEIFLKVNGILKKKKYGGNYNKNDINLPLKQFIKADSCGTTYTGYLVKRKNLYYYKNNRLGSKENVSAKKMHELFIDLLSNYQLKAKEFKQPLKEMMVKAFIEIHEDSINETIALNNKVAGLEKDAEKVERRYVLGEIERELYLKYKRQFDNEINDIYEQIENSQFKLSNLEKATDKAVEDALNLPQIWANGDLEEKQRIQKAVFPNGIIYNHEKHSYRTERVNLLFSAIPLFIEDLEGKKNGTSSKNKNLSRLVPEAGIEPALQRNTSLSRARLPVPPLGHFISGETNTIRNFYKGTTSFLRTANLRKK